MTSATRSDPSSVFRALDDAPLRWRHYAFWFVASGGALLDGYCVVALGLGLPLFEHQFAMSPWLVGLTGSALVFGAVVGAAVGGIAADRFGRKRVLVTDMTIVGVASLVAASASDPWVIVGAEFLLGLGIGSDFPTSGSYVSELMPKRVRSRMTVATIAMQSVGMAVAAAGGLLILDLHPSSRDWRLMLGAGVVLALLFLLGRLWAPESVRWLAIKGRFADAESLLRKLSREFGDQAEVVGTGTLVATNPGTAPPRSGGVAVRDLFGERYRTRALLVSLPWLLMDVATYGVGLFTPVILGAMRFGEAVPGSLAADRADAAGSAVVDLFLLLGFLGSLWAVPRFGRITMQIAGFGGMAAGMLLLFAATLLGDRSVLHLGLVIGGFVLFNFAMNVGPNATTFTLAPMLFPTTVRGAAAGLAAASGKIGATFGVFLVPQLQASWGLAGVVGVMLAVSLAGAIATALLAHAVNEEGELEE